MANAAGARFIMPSPPSGPSGTELRAFPPNRSSVSRAALANQPERIALRAIGETFVLPA